MTTSSEALEIGPPTLGDFFQAVSQRNPFTDNRITGSAEDDVDVESLNLAAFERLSGLAWETLNTRRGLGVVLWGQAGIGKSHLLARLARWARRDDRACLIYLHNLQASPDNLPRALLRAVVDALTWRERQSFAETPLQRLILTTLQDKLGTTGIIPWTQIEHTLRQEIAQHSSQGPSDAALADRTVQTVLFRFFRSVMRTGQGKEEGTVAELAVRWLRGDALSAEQGRELGLPPPRRPEGPIVLEDNQQIKQVLVALSALAAGRRQPFVLCFDQVDNLDEEQFAALARFLEALIDSARNLLVVTAGIQNSLLAWQEKRVIQESSWDRLAQFKIQLLRITPEQGRPLVEKRLQRFLDLFEELPEVHRLAFEDSLFPLGGRWYDDVMDGRVDVRPRDVINDARERWHYEQQLLAEEGGKAWLQGWRERSGKRNLLEVIDDFVDQQIEDHKKAVRVLPDPESLSESVEELLEQCCRLDADYGLLKVERLAKAKGGAAPTYHLLVEHRQPRDNSELRTGLVFVPTINPLKMFWVLDKLVDDEHPPQRVLLVADEDGPDVGTKGEDCLEKLRQRSDCAYKELHLSLADFATLDALHAVWNLARNDVLKLRLPDGTSRAVTAREVEESHHRQGRYRNAPVLAEVLTLPETVVVVQAVSPAVVANEATEDTLPPGEILSEEAEETD
jgi:hypothetical protein